MTNIEYYIEQFKETADKRFVPKSDGDTIDGSPTHEFNHVFAEETTTGYQGVDLVTLRKIANSHAEYVCNEIGKLLFPNNIKTKFRIRNLDLPTFKAVTIYPILTTSGIVIYLRQCFDPSRGTNVLNLGVNFKYQIY